MSDSENEQSSLEQTLARLKPGATPAKVRYQSTKGDADKRKITSVANMEKARQAKLAGLAANREKVARKQAKKAREIIVSDDETDESEDESDYSDESEEEVVVKKKKGKGQRGGAPPAEAPLTKADILELLQAQKKQKPKRKPAKRTIINVTAPAAAPVVAPKPENPHAEILRRNILKF